MLQSRADNRGEADPKVDAYCADLRLKIVQLLLEVVCYQRFLFSCDSFEREKWRKQ